MALKVRGIGITVKGMGSGLDGVSTLVLVALEGRMFWTHRSLNVHYLFASTQHVRRNEPLEQTEQNLDQACTSII